MVVRGWKEGGVGVFKEDRPSVWEHKEGLEIDGGNRCTRLWTPHNGTLFRVHNARGVTLSSAPWMNEWTLKNAVLSSMPYIFIYVYIYLPFKSEHTVPTGRAEKVHSRTLSYLTGNSYLIGNTGSSWDLVQIFTWWRVFRGIQYNDRVLV